jgi:opacity protein-like surface antigen
VSGLLSANLSEVIHAEVAAGYKNRDGDSFKTDVFDDPYKSKGADYETWAFLGGVYYDPVPQLTIGVEAEYFTVTNEATLENTSKANEGDKVQLDFEKDTFTLDLVSVWRF